MGIEFLQARVTPLPYDDYSIDHSAANTGIIALSSSSRFSDWVTWVLLTMIVIFVYHVWSFRRLYMRFYESIRDVLRHPRSDVEIGVSVYTRRGYDETIVSVPIISRAPLPELGSRVEPADDAESIISSDYNSCEE